MKTILVGYGNVGKALHALLQEHNIVVDYIVRSSGISTSSGDKVGNVDMFDTIVDNESVVYISVPSTPSPEKLHYYLKTLEAGGYVITCEKYVLAHNWHILKPYRHRLGYSATVGGNSGILPEIDRYNGEIHDIKAVINGTLNVISEESAKGTSEEEIFEYVTSAGFAEPGAKNFSEVIDLEMQDVLYKAVIFANHLGLYDDVITLSDIIIEPFTAGSRCMLFTDKSQIRVGFMHDDDTSWFPVGVNNVLLINGQKIVEGPGAGARATALRMYADAIHLA